MPNFKLKIKYNSLDKINRIKTIETTKGKKNKIDNELVIKSEKNIKILMKIFLKKKVKIQIFLQPF